MKTTKKLTNKFQSNADGSLVAGILAGSRQKARRQQVGTCPERSTKAPTKRAPKSKPVKIVEHPVDAIPLTDLALKKPEPIPSTSVTIDHGVVEEAARRAAVATLQRQHLLADWAEPILAYKLGRYFIEDRAQPAVSPVLVQGLHAIATLFKVDGNLTHGRYAKLFDPFGWRTTSLNEIRQLRKNLPMYTRPFSQNEACYILQDLNLIGFIEFKNGFDAKSESEQLIIRFRPDRILQTINALTVLRQAELGQIQGAGAATGKMAPGMRFKK